MFKFLYTILVSLILSWIGVFVILFNVPPDTFINITMFFIFFYIAITLTISLLLFAFKYDSRKRSSPKLFYRKLFKWAMFFGFIITGTLVFSAFDLLNILNYGLFTLFCVGIFYWLKNFR